MKIDLEPPDPHQIVQERATHKRYASWNPIRSARDLVACDAGSAQPRTDVDRRRIMVGVPPNAGDWGEQDSLANIPRKTIGEKMVAQAVIKPEDCGDA